MARLIDPNEFLQWVIKRFKCVPLVGSCDRDSESMKLLLSQAPTVDAVEVVHGRWVMRGGKRYCSACQQRACVTRDTDDFWYTVGTDYCPNCGADMRGAKDGNL